MNREDEPGGMGYSDETVFPNPDAERGESDDYYRMVVLSQLHDLQVRPDDEAFLDEVMRTIEAWVDYTREMEYLRAYNEGYDRAVEKGDSA